MATRKEQFTPLGDRVLVERCEADQVTPSGIIIPDTATEKPMRGKVLAVGPGARDDNGKTIPMDIKTGDIVLFGKWSGTEFKLGDKELLVMKASDIMGTIN